MMENLSVVLQVKLTVRMKDTLERWVDCVRKGVMSANEAEHRVVAYSSALFHAGALSFGERVELSGYYRRKIVEVASDE